MLLAKGADLLIHDAQFTHDEYPSYIGWGHSALPHTIAFAEAAQVAQLVPFHHDPSHTDEALDRLYGGLTGLPFELSPAMEGASFEVAGSGERS